MYYIGKNIFPCECPPSNCKEASVGRTQWTSSKNDRSDAELPIIISGMKFVPAPYDMLMFCLVIAPVLYLFWFFLVGRSFLMAIDIKNKIIIDNCLSLSYLSNIFFFQKELLILKKIILNIVSILLKENKIFYLIIEIILDIWFKEIFIFKINIKIIFICLIKI